MSVIYWRAKNGELLELAVREVSPDLKFALQREFVGRFDKGEAASFVEMLRCNIDAILTVPINYPEPPVFTFFVLERGENFHRWTSPFENGMCGVWGDEYNALAVDSGYFFNTNCYKAIRVGIIHELAHIVHRYFFYIANFFAEGFAEVIPYYIMNMEDGDYSDKGVARKDFLKSFSSSDIITFEWSRKNEIIPKGEASSKNRISVQYLPTYVSAFLWMRAYLGRLEKMRGIGKVDALNVLLSEFQKVDKLRSSENGKVFDVKLDYIAKLIECSKYEIFSTQELQLEALCCYRD
ncbi:MAG: hypothetical protein LBE20_05340 [Deltaproteobacteria bacterium]|jgi:hypothetical protein|nr:hypothetical protein [Deltaproteobacteria bacterium]